MSMPDQQYPDQHYPNQQGQQPYGPPQPSQPSQPGQPYAPGQPYGTPGQQPYGGPGGWAPQPQRAPISVARWNDILIAAAVVALGVVFLIAAISSMTVIESFGYTAGGVTFYNMMLLLCGLLTIAAGGTYPFRNKK